MKTVTFKMKTPARVAVIIGKQETVYSLSDLDNAIKFTHSDDQKLLKIFIDAYHFLQQHIHHTIQSDSEATRHPVNV